MEKLCKELVARDDVQELMRDGKNKDMRVSATVNDENYLVLRCDADTLEIGIRTEKVDTDKLSNLLHQQQQNV